MPTPRLPRCTRRLASFAARRLPGLGLFCWSWLSWSCVPRERPDEAHSGGERTAVAPSPVAPARSPRPTPKTRGGVDPLLTGTFRDDFNRARLGDDWRITSSAWKISDGRLCGENARNHPAWLKRRLPRNAVVRFLALSESPDGDIKAEVWGDGRSSASGQSYDDATSYLAIFGGWKNRFHVLARLDEHAPDRREIKLQPGSADFTKSTVVPNQAYRFQIERRNGRDVRWLVDDMEMLTYRDGAPLSGVGHEHFGFNDWQVRVCFDDLEVTALPD